MEWMELLRTFQLGTEAAGADNSRASARSAAARSILHRIVDAMIDKTDLIASSLADAAAHTAAAIAAGVEIAATAAVDTNGKKIDASSSHMTRQPWPDLTAAALRAAIEEADSSAVPAPEPATDFDGNIEDSVDSNTLSWLRQIPDALDQTLLAVTPTDPRFRESLRAIIQQTFLPFKLAR
eukprot:SAG31_NODE_95_length_25901_cov_24.763700_14_plen_181_part_00